MAFILILIHGSFPKISKAAIILSRLKKYIAMQSALFLTFYPQDGQP